MICCQACRAPLAAASFWPRRFSLPVQSSLFMHAVSPRPKPLPHAPPHANRRRTRCAAVAAAGSGAPLLIVGPGVLGAKAGQLWLSAGGGPVTAQTATETRHTELRALGFEPRVGTQSSQRFANVLFCAPPSGASDYAATVAAAAELWDSTAGGSLVFTSSSAVYADTLDAAVTTEETPTIPLGSSPRSDVLLRAEAAVLAAGGCVLRLAGLYTLTRGAHTYWLAQQSVPSRPDGVLNLLHYDDAATAALAALAARQRGRVFLACDGAPITRAQLMASVLASGLFPPGSRAPEFAATTGPLGKRLNCDASRRDLGWEPQFPSFTTFLSAQAAAGGR